MSTNDGALVDNGNGNYEAAFDDGETVTITVTSEGIIVDAFRGLDHLGSIAWEPRDLFEKVRGDQ